MRSRPFPENLRDDITEACGHLSGDSGLLAVRACSVADEQGVGEDSASDPFAGLSDSFLFVTQENVIKAVVECWASAFNLEMIIYRRARGLPPLGARIAVGIQIMIHGVRSCVAFTRYPKNGDNRFIIEAAYRIDKGVVQEKSDVGFFGLMNTISAENTKWFCSIECKKIIRIFKGCYLRRFSSKHG
ncbi:PEP/pyruvate-binding domain-containing protein [Sodalis sp. C49]|uniref:PEP/pyruvate-binding domain-containing protein n=1 Tax=unclassified Sodalis (in: enterobacteria) TaxID=2636512 RepID=UPI003965A197